MTTSRTLLVSLFLVWSAACFDLPKPGDRSGTPTEDGGGDADSAISAASDSGVDRIDRGVGCVATGEVCDGVDNDCDLDVDESFPEEGPCGVSIGACLAGNTVCVNGALTCLGAAGPSDEVCDGQDNDCDGQVDEDAQDMGLACGEGNECGPAAIECVAGVPTCVEPPVPTQELCNSVDDDCDGQVDEEVPETGTDCGGELGVCEPGIWLCTDGSLSCTGVEPSEEVCNELDDDCDGETDEDLERLGEVCADAPACTPGVWVCEGMLICEGASGGGPESCNGIDDDCDGFIDEEDPRLGERCGEALGACEPGHLGCVDGELACEGQQEPQVEICDGRDNDCDGEFDERDDGSSACPGVGQPCPADNRCDDGVCLNDLGDRYCTEACEAGTCPEGLYCGARAGASYCLRDFPLCVSEGDCDEGSHCQLVRARDDDTFGGECRPPLVGGAAVGGSCAGEDGPHAEACQTGICLSDIEVCSALCLSGEECFVDFACVGTPFRLGNDEIIDLGLCLLACSGDGDCQNGLLCQYNLEALGQAFVGYCDSPVSDGQAVGTACPRGADPPVRCDHGFCRTDATGSYCTQGCVDATDCPDDWACQPIEIPTAGGDVETNICIR